MSMSIRGSGEHRVRLSHKPRRQAPAPVRIRVVEPASLALSVELRHPDALR